MKKKIRAYLIKNTPKSLTTIPDGEVGHLSKIDEEYLELKDAILQKNNMLTYIEACDLASACLFFNSKQFKIPSIITVFVIYARLLYKPFRNRLYAFCGLNKDFFNTKDIK